MPKSKRKFCDILIKQPWKMLEGVFEVPRTGRHLNFPSFLNVPAPHSSPLQEGPPQNYI